MNGSWDLKFSPRRSPSRNFNSIFCLDQLGSRPDSAHRLAIFLTNALSGWHDAGDIKLNFPEMREEFDASQKVKREAKIIVILGNPPYDAVHWGGTAEEAELVAHYKGIELVEEIDPKSQLGAKRDEFGRPKKKQRGESLLLQGIHVRKQLLDDLYIRFIRLAEERIGEAADYGGHLVHFELVVPDGSLASADAALPAVEFRRGLDRQPQPATNIDRRSSFRKDYRAPARATTAPSRRDGPPRHSTGHRDRHMGQADRRTYKAQRDGRYFARDFWGPAALKRQGLIAESSERPGAQGEYGSRLRRCETLQGKSLAAGTEVRRRL